MVACQKLDLQSWDERLNDAYRAALARVGAKSRAQLVVAERAWIQFRDANCAVYESHGGTIHSLLGGGCLIRMSRERALELHGFDAGFE